MIFSLTQPARAAELFLGWEETLIWSCLQTVMGELYGDDPCRPHSVMAHLGDFSFFAGAPSRELALYRPPQAGPDFRILVPQNEAWSVVLADAYGGRAARITRYATRKDGPPFDRSALRRAAAALPPGFTLRAIDQPLFHVCRALPWGRDLVSQYPDDETYRRLGLGVVALRDGTPVAGASAYARYREGIEIEVDTREDFRRRGLARSCAAALVLACLERGLYPSWDAHTPASLALAEKLGYHFSHAYPAFEVAATG